MQASTRLMDAPLKNGARPAFPTVDTPSILQPPRQQRARDTEQALLTAGRELLASRDFAAIPVAQIASACKLSVGAFYGRFRDKKAFFESLRALVMRETEEAIDRYLTLERWSQVPTAEMLERTMRFLVNGCRANRGVIRASLRHAADRPEEWLPHRDSGEAFVRHMLALLLPRMPEPAASAELRVRFAMQTVLGMLVNAVLNDPAPLQLDDERLPIEMAKLVARYLELPA